MTNFYDLLNKTRFLAGFIVCIFFASQASATLEYLTSSASVQAAQQKISNNYQSAVGQSGIAAGAGGYDITVKGNTDLKGAAITTAGKAEDSTLSTDRVILPTIKAQLAGKARSY